MGSARTQAQLARAPMASRSQSDFAGTSFLEFEERTAYGYKRQDPYNKLFEDRVIFLGVQVDDASADDVMAQLLVLESQDPDRDIIMYIQLAGRRSFRSHDGDLRHHAVRVAEHPDGRAPARAALGSPRCCSRRALPWRRRLAACRTPIHPLIHQPAMGEAGHGQASDIEIQAAEILRMRTWLEETLAKHSNKTQEEVNRDIDRDKILSGVEALSYGLIDQVLTTRKRVPAALTK